MPGTLDAAICKVVSDRSALGRSSVSTGSPRTARATERGPRHNPDGIATDSLMTRVRAGPSMVCVTALLRLRTTLASVSDA